MEFATGKLNASSVKILTLGDCARVYLSARASSKKPLSKKKPLSRLLKTYSNRNCPERRALRKLLVSNAKAERLPLGLSNGKSTKLANSEVWAATVNQSLIEFNER